MRDEEKEFEIIYGKKDGEMELSVFEIKDKKTWIVTYRFFHDKNSQKNFYALKDGIGFVGGKGGLFKVTMSVTAPTKERKKFVESNVYVNLVGDNPEGREIVKIGNVTLAKAFVPGKGFQKQKFLMSVQLPPTAESGEYEGMMTITLD